MTLSVQIKMDDMKKLGRPLLTYSSTVLKLINNSTSYNKGNHNRDGGLDI